MVFSIIRKTQLEGAKRLDAEYYQPEYLEYSVKASRDGAQISDMVNFIRHPAEIERIYQEEGCPFLLTQNINKGSFILEFENKRYISSKTAETIKQNELENGDVVMTRTGANYGDSALYLGTPKNLFASAHILVIRPRDVSGAFLVTYFNSRIGRALVERGIYGGLQPEITPDYINSIPIPKIDKKENDFFENILNLSFKQSELSRSLYGEAENLFLNELNLNNFKQDEFLSSVINLSEAQTANRFDAEYFNSPCNKMLSQVINGKTAKLGDLVEITKGVEPGAGMYKDDGKLFIRVSSISKDGIIDKDQKYLSDDLYNEYKKDYQPQIGDILLTKDASIGVACVVRELVGGIVAGGVLRLKLREKMNPEYLALALNSIVGQLQAERDAGGSIIAHWKPEQIKNLVVPILPISIQEKIADLVVKSHEARKKAKELLEEAKLKVEEMIEKGGK